MSLTNIEYGSLASSAVMNNNFEYLDNRITTVANSLSSTASGISSNIATLNSTITGQINDINSDLSDLESDLDDLQDNFDSFNPTPNYANAIAITLENGDAIGFDGWLSFRFRAVGGWDVIIEINSVPVISGLADSRCVSGSTGVLLVSATDVITWSGPIVDLYFYKIPLLGGK